MKFIKNNSLRPLYSAMDTFLRESAIRTKRAPHIRDAVDLKRWMMLVVFALLPCILMAVWNTGVQKLVFTSGDFHLMNEFETSCHSFSDYFSFCLKNDRWKSILEYGFGAFLPIMVISYMAGGLAEAAFAVFREHEIAEGFLVSGMLYALILPPTIPYWMVAFGVIFGVIISKEIFGGTGMNIVNPAMTCRLLLFFTFPGQMSGDVWVGTNPTAVRESLITMNRDANLSGVDGYTQATVLAQYNVGFEVKRIHVDAIAMNFKEEPHVCSPKVIQDDFDVWAKSNNVHEPLGALPTATLKNFVTAPTLEKGLGLSPEYFEGAYRFATLEYAQGMKTNWNLFLGNKLGSLGETSVLASILGAIFLIVTGIGSWRTMVGMLLGALGMAYSFKLIGDTTSAAMLSFPPYKHLLMGSLAFGAVFMATDPVSSPDLRLSRWIYGIFIGGLVVLIRSINPAYPEGVMLATVTGNVFAPLIDHMVAGFYRRKRAYVRG